MSSRISTNTTGREIAEPGADGALERYRELVNTIDGIVWRADAESFRFSFVSPQAERILGYPITLWFEQGSFWKDHIHPDDREQAVRYCVESTRAGRSHDFEYRMIAADGRTVWLRDVVTVVMEEGRPRELHGVMVDITRWKEIEDELLQSRKIEGIGRLAGGIAHDFNNLLTALLGYSELASAKLPPRHPVHDDLNQIRRAAERSQALTRQLLAFARRQVVSPTVVDLGALVGDMSSMLERLLGEHVDVRLVRDPELWPVRADRSQIEQVVVNLAVNARDAMPKGGVLSIRTSNVTIDGGRLRHIYEMPPGDYALLTVEDSGVGLSSEAKRHLFEPFFTTKGPGRGTGLGLATCYGIVKQSGGHIVIDSESGRGTAVRVYLPRTSGSPEPPPSGPVMCVKGGSETILLVEDDGVVRDFIAVSLQELGYRVLEAIDGHEALRVADERKGEIDLLLTDVVMPRLDGRELAATMLADQPGISVLFMSGYPGAAVSVDTTPDPGFEFVPKPFSVAELAGCVRRTLDRRLDEPA